MRTAHRGHLCLFNVLCAQPNLLLFHDDNIPTPALTTLHLALLNTGGLQITTALHSTANSSKLRACSHWTGSCRDRTLRHYNTTVLTAARPTRTATTDPVLWVNEHLSCKDKYYIVYPPVVVVAKEQGCGGSLDSLEAMTRTLTSRRSHEPLMMMLLTVSSQWVRSSRP
jgi:hypothetical protein